MKYEVGDIYFSKGLTSPEYVKEKGVNYYLSVFGYKRFGKTYEAVRQEHEYPITAKTNILLSNVFNEEG